MTRASVKLSVNYMASNLDPPEPPPSIVEGSDDDQEAAPAPFCSPRLLAAATCIGLGLNVVAALMALYLQFRLNFPNAAGNVENADAVANQSDLGIWAGGVHVVVLLLRALTGVLFLAWTYRVHRNLLALRHRSLDWKPISGLVVWFIPLVNLVLPCIVMREIAWRSDPRAEILGRENRFLTVVNWWWVLFLLSPLSFCIELFSPELLLSLPDAVAFRFNVVLYTSMLGSGLLACWIVTHITGQQLQRLSQLADSAPPSVPVGESD